MKLEVTHHDNRGDAEYPYGFVYFNDGRRVAYTGQGVTDITGGWPAVGPQYPVLAATYLGKKGVLK